MPGDQILTDSRLILLEDTALNPGSKLIILAFTRRKKQLSTRKIASARIHTEKVIELTKNRQHNPEQNNAASQVMKSEH